MLSGTTVSRDPSLCLEELYAKVQKPVARTKPEPLAPKPSLSGDRNSTDIYAPPELPKRTAEPRYSEIVFDDDKPG